ncbi:translational GTPase TypA, partial [Bacillus subtilis]
IKGRIGGRRNGVLVSIDKGTASTYAILNLEDRGVNFMEPGTEVYEGMIVGENNRENDLSVNITKVKAANNIRSATKEQTTTMKKPRILTLEEALEYLNDDELVEITPESIRIRKKILDKAERERAQKRQKMAEQEE